MIKPTFLAILLALFAGLTVLLGIQNGELERKVAKLEAEQHLPRPGDWLPQLNVTDIDGRALVIGGGEGRRQALFFFTTACRFCLESMPFIMEIEKSFSRLGVDFIAITPEKDGVPVRNFIRTHSIRFPVVSIPDERSLKLLRFRISPTVLLVNGVGKIEHAKIGQIKSNKEAFDLVSKALQKDPKVLASP